MKLSQLTYTLPESAIAHSPSTPRDHAKLLLLNKETNTIIHSHFYTLSEILTDNDVLVFNNTKVFPARLLGKKETGGEVEILLLNQKTKNTWEAMHRGKVVRGMVLAFTELMGTVISKDGQLIIIEFDKEGKDFLKNIDLYGQVPLPPYIESFQNEAEKRESYQTVFAEHSGSVAAPTAGLHFTKELIQKLQKNGVEVEYVTLQVGLGTFLPIKNDNLTEHPMHSELATLDQKTADRLNTYKKIGKRIIAVGTTTTRVLESCMDAGTLVPQNKLTNIFIYPPYKFKFIDALITNFHLPESTLLALVSALVSNPNTTNSFSSFEESIIGKAYTEALQEGYKFYSFGDGMLIY